MATSMRNREHLILQLEQMGGSDSDLERIVSGTTDKQPISPCQIVA